MRVRYDICPSVYVQAGVYDGNPDRGFSGTDFDLGKEEGALSYFEVGFKHNQGKDATGLPGNFKIGAWYHTDDFYDMYEGTFVAFDNYVAANGLPLPPVSTGNATPRQGNSGFYILVDHVLWREPGQTEPTQQGLAGFFRVAGAPRNRNLAQVGIDGGLVYKGLIPTRDWDTFGVALSYLEISDELRRAQADINAAFGAFGPVLPEADYEAVLEVNYKAQVAAWCAVDCSACSIPVAGSSRRFPMPGLSSCKQPSASSQAGPQRQRQAVELENRDAWKPQWSTNVWCCFKTARAMKSEATCSG